MHVIIKHTYGSPHPSEVQERLARLTGVLYLVLAVFGMLSSIILERLVVPRDGATTANNISANFFVADYGGVASRVMLTPVVVGELGLTAWLLVKGVKVRREVVSSADPQIAGAMGGAQ